MRRNARVAAAHYRESLAPLLAALGRRRRFTIEYEHWPAYAPGVVQGTGVMLSRVRADALARAELIEEISSERDQRSFRVRYAVLPAALQLLKAS